MNIRKLLLIFATCFFASCATSQSINTDTYTDEDDPYFGSFEVMAARMGIVLARPEHETDQVTFLLHDSFTHTIAIAAYYDRDQTVPPGYLTAVIRDIRSDIFEDKDGVTKGSYTFKTYETAINAGQFSKIREAASSTDFLEQSYSNRIPEANAPQCLDGTIYAIGARINGENHVVRRHNCDEGYSQSIAVAAPLISAAKSAFPELKSLLTNVESNVKSWD